MHRLQALWLNLIFPPRCPFCKSVIAQTEVMCASCKKQFACTPEAFEIFGAAKCVSLFPYSGEARRAILAFKFQGFRGAARGFGISMAEAVREQIPTGSVVTFVPMDRRRQQERGYNQAQLLAKEIATRLALPCRPLLQKTRRTVQQHTLSWEERRKNARGAFAATENARGKDILLCDDIVTTGETLRECAKALREAGAGSVFCVTIAHAGVEIGGKIDYNIK